MFNIINARYNHEESSSGVFAAACVMTQCHIPEHQTSQYHCCQNLKTHTFNLCPKAH